jgi:hypothetical protein
MKTVPLAAALLAIGLTIPLALTETARAAPPAEIDQSLLVPTTLDSSFAPFTCKLRVTGPVCTGERHIVDDWAPTDFPCPVPIYGSYVEDRYQTRYYNHDYLNYDRHFRTNNVDYLSTSPDGPATGTISTNVRFDEPFAVPGDDSTLTVISHGVNWDVRPVNGPAIFRAVGTLIEPPGELGTFTGHVTVDGDTTRYTDTPLDTFITDDKFAEWVCRAATGT